MNLYFLQAGEGGPIKIGIARDVTQRVKELQVGSPSRLIVLAICPGGRPEESALHRKLIAHHRHGEWFDPAKAVMAEVGRAQKIGAGRAELEAAKQRKGENRAQSHELLMVTFAAVLLSAYGGATGWKRRAAADANVSVECVKSWLKMRALPRGAPLINLGRNCAAVAAWIADMVAVMDYAKKNDMTDVEAFRLLYRDALGMRNG